MDNNGTDVNTKHAPITDANVSTATSPPSEVLPDSVCGTASVAAPMGTPETTKTEKEKTGEDYWDVCEGIWSELLKDHVERVYGHYDTSIVYLNKHERICVCGTWTPASLRIWPRAMVLQEKPIPGLEPAQTRSYKQCIAAAIIESLDESEGLSEENRIKQAELLLDEAEAFRRDRLAEVSRRWTLLFTLLFAVVAILCGCLAFVPFRTTLTGWFGEFMPRAAMVGVFGAIGAFISVCLRLGTWTVSTESGKLGHFLEAFARIATGAVSALAIAMAVEAGLLLNDMGGLNQILLVQLLGLFAGLSERAIPHLASQLPIVGSTTSSDRK